MIMIKDSYRPRRSMLYVPGCNQRYLDKAKSLHADTIILDLGDPILIDAKEQSRINVAKMLKKGGYGKKEVVVRVNDLDSPWGDDDIKTMAPLNPDAILFPNIETREDILNCIHKLDEYGGKDIPVMIMIESPLAVLNVKEIASASDRIVCLVLATSDLISQMYARVTQSRIALTTSLSMVILAARAYGKSVIDGIHSNLKDTDAFEYACRMGKDMGFDGKSLVHPDQLAYANDAYTPKPKEIAQAKEIITALADANASGRGTVVVNDRLVEHHHVTAAKRLLIQYEMMQALEEDHQK
jgi:citrate lyase subunit beta/citryl-CoA lyase